MRYFAEFTRKHLCCNLFLDKVKLCRSAISLKTSSLAQVLFLWICKICRNIFFAEHLPHYSSINSSDQKPKDPSSSPAACYVQRWAVYSNAELMSKCLCSGWKWQWGVNEMLSHFRCSPLIRECLWKKTYLKKKGLVKGNNKLWNKSWNIFSNISYKCTLPKREVQVKEQVSETKILRLQIRCS